MSEVRLRKDFDTKNFKSGASWFKMALWYFTSVLFFRSGIIPFSSVLVGLLRAFGATIGTDVRIKPHLHVKYPWRLEIGDHSWVAGCYIENLAKVSIGKNACLSQGCMILTGNHDFSKSGFDLITGEIHLEDGTWIGAQAVVCPGITVGSHAVLTVGSVATKDLEPYSINQGNPAQKVRERTIN